MLRVWCVANHGAFNDLAPPALLGHNSKVNSRLCPIKMARWLDAHDLVLFVFREFVDL